jgi:hypothetical protein
MVKIDAKTLKVLNSDNDLVGGLIVTGAVNSLRGHLEESNKQNSILQKRIFWLTIATTALVLIQTVVIVLELLRIK